LIYLDFKFLMPVDLNYNQKGVICTDPASGGQASTAGATKAPWGTEHK
jgi:hypothetical protein